VFLTAWFLAAGLSIMAFGCRCRGCVGAMHDTLHLGEGKNTGRVPIHGYTKVHTVIQMDIPGLRIGHPASAHHNTRPNFSPMSRACCLYSLGTLAWLHLPNTLTGW
jgi:hypothetical protein